MQRHVDIYRHKVIMGVHTKIRRDKNGDAVMPAGHDSFLDDHTENSAMELEIN